MPTVAGVIFLSISMGSIVKVSSSVSQNTTRPPACVIVSDVETQDRDQTSDVGGPRTEERCVISDLSQQKSAVTGQTSEGKKKDCLPYFRAWLRSRDIPHSILHDLVSPNNRTHRRNLANCQSHHSLRRHP